MSYDARTLGNPRSESMQLFCCAPGLAKPANLLRCESAHGVCAPLSSSSPVCRSRPRSRGWPYQVTARDRRAKGCVDPSSGREELEVRASSAATVRARKPRPSEPELPSVPGLENRSIPSAFRSAFWRQRGLLHFESQSTSFSSHCLRIDVVVFLMRSKKSNHQNAIYVLNLACSELAYFPRADICDRWIRTRLETLYKSDSILNWANPYAGAASY